MWDLYWQQEFPDLRVAVWVANGPQFGVQYTGRTPEEIANITQEVIARHNESNVGPRLYFAGFTDVELDLMDEINPSVPVHPGIYIHSVECTLLDANAQNPAFCDVTGFTPPIACGAVVATEQSKARVFIRPATCPSVPSAPFGMATFEGLETPSILLHEIGHTLGLAHSDETCDGMNVAKGNGPDNTIGVMQRLAAIDDRVGMREWRKDDIDGLASLYPTPDYSDQVILYWNDSSFPNPPADQDLIRLELTEPIMRPPSVATNSSGDIQVGISVSPQDAVIYYIWDEPTDEIIEHGLVEPGQLGITYSSPAVALGEESILVVWHSGEDYLDPNGRLRWGLRELGGGPWTYVSSSFEIESKRFGAGYDPATGHYLITMLTDKASLVQVLEVDAAGQEVLVTPLSGIEGFDVGNAICAADAGARDCVIPYTRSQIGGPYLGWITLGDNGLREVIGTTTTPGMQVDITRRHDVIGGFLGTTGAHRYAVADSPSGISSAPLLSSPYTSEGWPFETAEYVSEGKQRTRVFTRRFTECGDGQVEVGEICDDGNMVFTDDCVSPFCKLAECGDGFLWAGIEECDDGNVDFGDGCSDVCLLEGDETGETGETGGAVDELGANGCECQIQSQRGLPAGPLALLTLLRLGRRWRRRDLHFSAR